MLNYYLESDGQVFLVKERGRWRFPRARREIPCPFTPIRTIPVGKHKVLFARPHLSCHPQEWFHKDDLIGRNDVDPVVRLAVNRTLPRGAAKVAVIERGKVLMVKARRGITQGYWNLPGGFISYSESPAEGVRREVREELGTDVRLTRLLGIFTETFPRTGGYMYSFVYQGKRLSKILQPDPDEIEALGWFSLRKAIQITQNPFAKAGLRAYLKKSISRHA